MYSRSPRLPLMLWGNRGRINHGPCAARLLALFLKRQAATGGNNIFLLLYVVSFFFTKIHLISSWHIVLQPMLLTFTYWSGTKVNCIPIVFPLYSQRNGASASTDMQLGAVANSIIANGLCNITQPGDVKKYHISLYSTATPLFLPSMFVFPVCYSFGY